MRNTYCESFIVHEMLKNKVRTKEPGMCVLAINLELKNI